MIASDDPIVIKASVHVALARDEVRGRHYGPETGRYLPPAHWEALRLEMQRRYRLATGEMDAVLTVRSGEDHG